MLTILYQRHIKISVEMLTRIRPSRTALATLLLQDNNGKGSKPDLITIRALNSQNSESKVIFELTSHVFCMCVM